MNYPEQSDYLCGQCCLLSTDGLQARTASKKSASHVCVEASIFCASLLWINLLNSQTSKEKPEYFSILVDESQYFNCNCLNICIEIHLSRIGISLSNRIITRALC